MGFDYSVECSRISVLQIHFPSAKINDLPSHHYLRCVCGEETPKPTLETLRGESDRQQGGTVNETNRTNKQEDIVRVATATQHRRRRQS